MYGNVVLAIDAGGSVVKAAAFDVESGQMVCAARPVPLAHPVPGRSERDPEVLWAATAECVREVLAGLSGCCVLTVGLTSHGNGLYLVDKRGRPVRAAIMASDTRAAPLVRRWAADGLEPVLQVRSWNGLWAGQPGPILAALALEEPSVLARAYAAASCKDYLWAKLTGVLEAELTAASAGGLYDSAAWAEAGGVMPLPVSEVAVTALGLERWRHLLPTPIDPATVRPLTPEAASATGLPAGTPVVAGLVDNAAMQHGSGVFDSGTICAGAGTWSINQVLVPARRATGGGLVAVIRPNAANIALGRTALLCEASPTSASMLDWALRQAITAGRTADEAAGRDAYAAQLEREGERVRSPDDPLFLPFLDGSRTDSGARGAWVGLSSATGERDLLGAVIEGVCLEHRRHVDRLQAGLPGPVPVRLSGGATRSAVWCQRFADTLGVPVEVSPVTELGCVGAAALAGVACGVYSDVSSGVGLLNPEWCTYVPSPDGRDFEAARYARYCRYAELFDHRPWEES